MSNLKKDIDEILNTLYEDILVSESELADGDRKTSLEIVEQALKQATTQIINLIESVIPEEIDVKSKYETDDDGGIIVVVDENNDTMTGENLVHLARLASDEGYNQAIKDIKNKLIGKE